MFQLDDRQTVEKRFFLVHGRTPFGSLARRRGRWRVSVDSGSRFQWRWRRRLSVDIDQVPIELVLGVEDLRTKAAREDFHLFGGGWFRFRFLGWSGRCAAVGPQVEG